MRQAQIKNQMSCLRRARSLHHPLALQITKSLPFGFPLPILLTPLLSPLLKIWTLTRCYAKSDGRAADPTTLLLRPRALHVAQAQANRNEYTSMSRFTNSGCNVRLHVSNVEHFQYSGSRRFSDGSHGQGSNRPNARLDASLGSASGVCRTFCQGSSPCMLCESALQGCLTVLPAVAEHLNEVFMCTF